MRSLYQLRIPILLMLLAVLVTGTTAHRAYAGPAGMRLSPFTWSSTCAQTDITFTILATAGIDSVKWDFGDPLSGNANFSAEPEPLHNYSSAGDYTVTLITYTDGAPDTTRQPITIVTPIPYDFPYPYDVTLCEGQTLTLDAPVIPGATYEWSRPDSVRSSIVADTTATYQVKINGCLVPDSVNIFYTPIPELELGDDHTLCTGEALRLDATAQNGAYQWFRDGVNTGETGSTYVVTGSGTYSVTVDAQGCGAFTDQVTINFAGSPHPFSLGPDTLLCPGESVTLAPNVTGATRYLWSTGSRNPSIRVSNEADIWVFVEIDRECEVLDTIGIRFNALRPLNLGNDTVICKGESLVLTADYGRGSYLWQDGSEQATFYVREPGSYYVRAQIGRCIDSDTIQVLYDDTLRVNLGPDTVLCRGEQLLLRPARAGLHYKWQDSTSVPAYTVTEPGIYALVANNACGRSVDSVLVLLTDCECQLFLPTAFSPNGDGINDYFRPRYRCQLTDYKLSVYDRWGRRVFFSSDPGVAWTGRTKGVPLNTGTYVWIVEYRNAKAGQPVRKSGSVTIIY